MIQTVEELLQDKDLKELEDMEMEITAAIGDIDQKEYWESVLRFIVYFRELYKLRKICEEYL